MSNRKITFDLYMRDLASDPYRVASSVFRDRYAVIDFRGTGVNGRVALLSGCQHTTPVDITLQQAAVTGQ